MILILWVYLLGIVPSMYKIWPVIYASLDPDVMDLDAMDRGLCFIMTALCGALWPVVLVGRLFVHTAPKTYQQRKKELDEREARIREMEKENGIG